VLRPEPARAALGTIPELGDLDVSALRGHVSLTAFDRGGSYARSGRVLSLVWDADEWALSASVVGNGATYETCAYFDEEGGSIAFVDGECSCPIGHNCKHVAAIVLAAAQQRGRARHGIVDVPRPAPHPPAPGDAPGPSAWELPLRALAAARGVPAIGIPLAIELGFATPRYPDNGAPRLMARLMRPGARGGWVNGSLNWGGYGVWQLRNAGHRDDHIALVRELYSVHHLREGSYSYDSGYSSERSLELSACESPQLWSLLGEAERLGLPLIHADRSLGEVPVYRDGELVLDVTRDRACGWSVGVVLRVGGSGRSDLVPMRFVGRTAHGIVSAVKADVDAGHGPEHRRLALVGLARPAVAQLERMLLGGERLAIPELEIGRFAEELCPALRHVAPVVSSDGSFEPPAVSDPELVLQTRYGASGEVEVGWAWAYQIGSRSRRASVVHGGLEGFRDEYAERALLRSTVLTGTGLERIVGLVDDGGRPVIAPPAVLGGVAGLELATEVLPRVSETSGVRVEIDGKPPDYRDVGESLEIGVATGEIAGEHDWFDLGVTITAEGREVPFADVFTALALGESRMLLDDGAWFSLRDARLQRLRQLIEEARGLIDASPTAPLRISRYQADLWSELVALGVVGEQAERWRRLVTPLLELDALPETGEPRALRADLRPYQREGFSWLAALWDLELGGILADDMGLGKTLQALALICHARERGPEAGPFLVVAPTSVAPNWAAEAARFAPGLDVEVVLDTLARSGRAVEEVARAEVVITTYTLFRLECDEYQRVAWAGLILDEAQYVKNQRGKTYRCARQLNAPFKLAITGTPMENNLMELWAMLSLTAPGLFPDPQRFGEHYARPIERGADPERLGRLRRRIKPLIKRRTKELVAAELPPKQEQTLAVELHPRHRKLYDTQLQRERAKVLRLLDDFDRNRFMILTSITRLRQLSLHAGLVDDRHRTVPCAKLGALVEQLDDVVSSGHRTLVFSQFTQFLGMVRERLDEEGIGYCYLDGRTRRRDDVIHRFRSGQDPVFLISLKAGGVGLNLVEADYCFLLDPWWNPATEAQAIDRTHRIGQSRPVMVYRLISQNTIEEKVRALAERKAKLFQGVMDDGDLFAQSLTAEDIRGLLD
jgi:superfamily II DNA or RNA helicase